MTLSSLEFSRLVNIPLRAAEGESLHFTATDKECSNLAKRFGLEALKKFEMTLFFLHSQHSKTYPLQVNFDADVTYTCVKTLDPFEDHVKETVYFTAQEPSLSESDEDADDLIFTGEEETTELLDSEGVLELGEIMAQYLSLALNPYPRASDHTKKSPSKDNSKTGLLSDEDSTQKKPSTYFPFENLARLKSKNNTSTD
ncbi:MAG: hypothetical protein B7Y25_02225 [Alphaproteobacteria bacterium 16-39-46]|nr:MAG: hypothetical protein B7Y25_02225 [Alphaproteobacteria bacterium 16-39-46]OZA43671.1 MAG: hypothetical protein B7X84_02525 [Alphaproteobacteria bacterium 17-39-52]HQS83731.1 YceD family protein [Alphaproteobacteria bacterium]HQS93510.1 YceD family protein [Alphaproteobacteria bacterium]